MSQALCGVQGVDVIIGAGIIQKKLGLLSCKNYHDRKYNVMDERVNGIQSTLRKML